MAEERATEPKIRSIKNLSNLKNRKKNEQSIRDQWNNIKWSKIYVIEVSEGEERENRTEKIFEEMMA